MATVEQVRSLWERSLSQRDHWHMAIVIQRLEHRCLLRKKALAVSAMLRSLPEPQAGPLPQTEIDMQSMACYPALTIHRSTSIAELEHWAEGNEAHLTDKSLASAVHCTTLAVAFIKRYYVERILQDRQSQGLSCKRKDRDAAALHVGQLWSAVLEDLFANIFLGCSLETSWIAWNERTVWKLATTIYKKRSYHELPILADALEDAGCQSEPLLTHLRQHSSHYRGCWALDFLLEKEAIQPSLAPLPDAWGAD